jgi:soluble lytic murein transglycosylase-like protein
VIPMRRLYRFASMLFGMMGLCAISAHGQIVSYHDDTGKMVFINADPKPVMRPATAAAKAAPSPIPGFKALPAQNISIQTGPVQTALNQTGPIQTATNGLAVRTTQAQATWSNPNETIVQSSPADIAQMVREVSSRYHVDPELIEAVVQTESHGNPSAVSRRGAQGLMQLVPETAYQMGVKDAFDPKQNLDGGVRYLQTLLERYNGNLDKALAAYNAGPGAVDRAGGVPRYRETRAYVQKVTNSYYRPGADRLPNALNFQNRIYRAVDSDGRIVFTNE